MIKVGVTSIMSMSPHKDRGTWMCVCLNEV